MKDVRLYIGHHIVNLYGPEQMCLRVYICCEKVQQEVVCTFTGLICDKLYALIKVLETLTTMLVHS